MLACLSALSTGPPRHLLCADMPAFEREPAITIGWEPLAYVLGEPRVVVQKMAGQQTPNVEQALHEPLLLGRPCLTQLQRTDVARM